MGVEVEHYILGVVHAILFFLVAFIIWQMILTKQQIQRYYEHEEALRKGEVNKKAIERFNASTAYRDRTRRHVRRVLNTVAERKKASHQYAQELRETTCDKAETDRLARDQRGSPWYPE